MKICFLGLLIVFLTSFSSKAQVLHGIITDTQNRTVPFSTVFVKELSFGTAANEDGQFELRLEEGSYTFVFQCMGYQTVTRNIEIHQQNEPLQIILPGMVYSLKEVEVSDGGEDPAYRIMRRVIRKAPLYAGMVKSFKAEVYIRGSLNIRKISAMVKWMAREDLKKSEIREGGTYLEESVNEIEFTSPDKTRQKVKSIHSTFPGGNENRSSGAIGFISGNIYQPGAFGNARSPLAPGAFNYYKFRYEGVNTYGDVVVDKIKVIPKGDGPQFVSGYLYIIEGLWCIYSLDISINEQLGMTIQLNQSYGEVREGAWLPVNNRFKIDADLLGNAGGFLYSTSIRYHSLDVNPPDLKPSRTAESVIAKHGRKEAEKEARTAKLDKKAAGLMSIENPSTAEAYRLARINNRKAELLKRDSLRNNHEYVEHYKTVFDSNARKTDSVFWNRVRPIPLAANELKSVKAFDSIQFRQSGKAADSAKTSNPGNKKIFNTLLFGGRIEPDTTQFLRTDGLLNPFGVSFNTVDGLVYKMGMSYQRKLNRSAILDASVRPGYAFSRKTLFWLAGLGFSSNGRYRNSLRLQFGTGSFDFNTAGGAAILENTVASLFFRQNLMRLFDRDFIELKHSIDLATGLKLRTVLSASEARKSENNSDFSFFYNEKREYKPNVPDNPHYRFANHREFISEIVLTYKPTPFYVIREGIRTPRPGMNQTPEFSLSWRKGIPVGGFETDFDLVHFCIDHKFRTGLKGNFGYILNAGYFLTKRNIFFNEFRHFQSQPIVTGIKNFYPLMQMGDYYRYSTDSYYAEGHIEYKTPYLLLKRLPLVRNRLWEESLLLNYLYTPDYKHCIEFGYGIGNYFYNIGFFTGLETGRFRTAGLRISIPVLGKREIVVGL
ncbi:MAG: DUF5686 and carboxypeptidase regulatory-like domain-containing protein [Bacteroidota bacterium]